MCTGGDHKGLLLSPPWTLVSIGQLKAIYISMTTWHLNCMPPPPPVPIIASVEVAVLSLFEVEVNISLLTNGGQSVTQYTVSWLTVCACSFKLVAGVCRDAHVTVVSLPNGP